MPNKRKLEDNINKAFDCFVKKPEGVFCPIMVYPKISMDNFEKVIKDVEKYFMKASEE